MITVLIGHRGVGKSNLLRRIDVALSGREDVMFRDLDREIEVAASKTIPEIFKTGGEAEFRTLERQTFFRIIKDFGPKTNVFVAVGAGFEFDLPDEVHRIWIRRRSDETGRVFLDRPKLSDGLAMFEWKDRFSSRDPRFRELASEELMLPEGSLHDSVLEDFFFGGANGRNVPYTLTLKPENFKSPAFLSKRSNWGLASLEIRDDLLTPEMTETLKNSWPSDKLLYSIRGPAPADRPGFAKVDWPIEKGEPPFPVEILSYHRRDDDLEQTIRYLKSRPGVPGSFARQRNATPPVLKWAPEIRNFGELIAGHRWWKEDPQSRAFLPSSPTGRWQWYRQLFGPSMPIHFIREGDGTAPDQPFLWQALTTIKWERGFAAVLGSPVTASWTPTFQREFFEPLGMPVVAIDVSEAEWDAALPILTELGLRAAAVTSPLKQKAFTFAEQTSPEAALFSSVNTLVRSGGNWVGHSTDRVGAEHLLQSAFKDSIPILVYGGGGTRNILRDLLPNAEFFSARGGVTLKAPVNIVWAVGRSRNFEWPNPAVFVQSVVDLNYGEDSPGRELAQRAGCPYRSGETMFIHQGLAQREFWKRFV